MIKLNDTKGLFISVESVEFGGKTTLIKNFQLDDMSKVVKTREPGSTPESEQIREWLLNPNKSIFDNSKTRAVGYALARSFNVKNVVLPALDKGKLVISDRYIHSSFVLQGLLQGLHIDDIGFINYFSIGADKVEDIMPDYTIYIDITEEEMLRRVGTRGILNELDAEFIPQFNKIRNSFLEFSNNENFIVMDGQGTFEEVQLKFDNLVKSLISKHNL